MTAPRRLTPLRSHPIQQAVLYDPIRFKVVPAGRRSGKTELAKRKLLVEALSAYGYDDPRFFAAAPTRDQAKTIWWNDLKAMSPQRLVTDIRETELAIYYVNGSSIHVVGMDKPQRIEGSPWNGGVMDEFANMKPNAWQENVRPALSDRLGWCWLIGVPEGRNHYYELNQKALSGKDKEWRSYTWPSADILPASEVEAARRDLEPLIFAQEYEASFINFEGRCYYPFLAHIHAPGPSKLTYNPRAPLIFCFDFNVEPGVAAVCQEQTLPGQYERDPKTRVALLDKPITGTGVIGEVHIPRNSNTPAVCKKLAELYKDHQGDVRCYGDATGGARGSAKVAGSDWDIIKTELRPVWTDRKGETRVSFHVRASNPPERSRVNAVNTRLINGLGEIRLMVDPAAAPNVVKDLEGVVTLKGGSGEIDKKTTPLLTHVSDALGYYIEREFSIGGHGAVVQAMTV